MLKYLLVLKTDLPQEQIIIGYDAQKNPIWSPGQIFFNVSHTEDFAVLAFADIPLGIDVEKIKFLLEMDEIMRQTFSSGEMESTINSTNKTFEFLKYWTRKEALTKASGRGITEDFSKFNCVDGYNEITVEAQ